MCYNFGLSNTTVIERRFSTEFRELHGLPTHPNVVQLHTHFTEAPNDALYQRLPPVAQELVWRVNPVTGDRTMRKSTMFVTALHSRTLDAALREMGRGARPIRFVVRVLADVATALDHCLQYGVVHLDIKPDNILLDGDMASPTAVLCDFGCAIRVPMATLTDVFARTDTPFGNLPHIAPELRVAFDTHQPMCVAKQPSFEVGVLGYELLTGAHPLDEYPVGYESGFEYGTESVPELSVAQCGGHARLGVLLRSMVACDPAQRPSIAEAHAQLRAIASML